MRQFAMIATALTMFAAMVGTALADDIHGAPLKNGNQCFNYSKGNEKDARFGSWGACPQTASTSAAAATPQTARRSRAASR